MPRPAYAAALLLLLAVTRPSLAGFTWRVEDGGNGHHYELVLPTGPSGNFTWSDARDAAAASTYRGSSGHLVTITSSAEDAFLKSAFESSLRADFLPGSSGDFAWIGLTDAASEGTFRWVTGETFSYSNWAPPEPNNLFDEDYVHLWRRDYSDGAGPRWSWNDSDPGPDFTRWDTARVGYIVEYDGPFTSAVPAPPTALLLAPAALGLLAAGSAGAVRRGREPRSRVVAPAPPSWAVARPREHPAKSGAGRPGRDVNVR